MTIRLPGPLVGSDFVQKHLDHQDLRILDCSVAGKPNGDGTYNFIPQREECQQRHIPGSVFVDIPEQLSDQNSAVALMMPEPEAFAEIMQNLGIGNGKTVILYDRSNHAWAARVWWMLKVCGFENAAVLNGGFNKWQAEGRSVGSGENTYPAAESFTVHARPELMAKKQSVINAMTDNDIVLVNSLPEPVFTGEVSVYARPGRIPSSKNLSCDSIVDAESHCYLDIETLRKMAEDSGALSGQKVITYCGGGIAASSTAFILEILGVDNISIYDGSLSEWTVDPALPMETGPLIKGNA